MNVLVYDNQMAYYELLRNNFSGSHNIMHYPLLNSKSSDYVCDVMIFFLHDELEILDFVKLYNKDIPVILGIGGAAKFESVTAERNIYYLHLDKLKEEILEDVALLLQRIYV
ncbi:hypothetical protein AMR72_13045 [Flavobacterium psychrophilum]|nr:hypothetical protein AMR72_13045 [Flavobacterium psychrophilum]AOE53363.1 hypothetical protein ALW18_13035 [Flavobacterium psychrophilum]